jgi:ParB family chromosome partitioning protein
MSKVKHGLGKGLSALIRPAAVSAPPTVPASPSASAPPAGGPSPQGISAHRPPDGGVALLEVARIRPNPFQPRADFDQQALDELKESIKLKGIIQPVTVRRAKEGMFELISGERRIRAAQEIGLRSIPAYVLEVRTDEEMLELALIENLQREHLNPIEIAISYQRLISDVNLTPEDVATRVSKDRTTVVNFLRLLKLPEKIQTALRKADLTMGHARALVNLPGEHVQLRMFDKIVKNGLNVRQVEKLVRDLTTAADKKRTRKPGRSDSAVNSIESRIQQVLGTKVKISTLDGGRGEILIEFYSSDDLERLYDLLLTIRP